MLRFFVVCCVILTEIPAFKAQARCLADIYGKKTCFEDKLATKIDDMASIEPKIPEETEEDSDILSDISAFLAKIQKSLPENAARTTPPHEDESDKTVTSLSYEDDDDPFHPKKSATDIINNSRNAIF